MERLYNDFFGCFGGKYVAEILRTPLDELKHEWLEAMKSKDFKGELDKLDAVEKDNGPPKVN